VIFIDSKYTNIYNSIVTQGQSRKKTEGIYYEKHHIIPKSLGGDNSPANLVALTAREHYVCHLLLIRMTSGAAKTKMVYAVWRMMCRNTASRRNYKVSSHVYQSLKLQRNAIMQSRRGKDHPNFGKKTGRTSEAFTDEWRKNLSLAKKGKSVPWNKGVSRTAEVKEKVSATRKAMAGTDGWNVRPPCSKEKANKIAEANRGKKWVHSSTERRYVDPQDAEALINSGWKYGTGPRNYSGTIFT